MQDLFSTFLRGRGNQTSGARGGRLEVKCGTRVRKGKAQGEVVMKGRTLIAGMLAGLCGVSMAANAAGGHASLLENGSFEEVPEAVVVVATQSEELSMDVGTSGTVAAGTAGGSAVLPESWAMYSTAKMTMDVSTRAQKSGKRSLMIRAQGVVDAHMGALQKIAVLPMQRYEFTAHVLNDPTNPLTGPFYGVLSIEWVDKNGDEIKRDTSKKWDETLAQDKWTRFRLVGRAPAQAREARFVIHAHDGWQESSGACFVDDATVVRK